MQDGVLDAADVLVDRHPVARALVDHALVLAGTAEAREVPRRIDERIHGVGLALRGAAARRALRLEELGQPGERIAGAVGHEVLGQPDRQLLVGHRDVAAGRAMHDRDRAAPVALARDAPVAQAPLHLLVAQAFGAQVGRDGLHRRLVGQAVIFPGIDAHAVLGVLGPPRRIDAIAQRMADHRLDRQSIFVRELVIALVVRRHRHHRAFAVAHQHVIRHPYLQLLARERMRHRHAGRHALLLDLRELGFHRRAALAFLDERRNLGISLRRPLGDRVLGGDGAEGRAHQRIGARGEDRVLGDAQEVHRDLALLDQRAGAPAAAFDHLLIREHRLVDGIPVDDAGLLVRDAFFEQTGEEPLVPLVVIRIAGGELARPVEREAEAFQLRLHVGDVVVRPARRRHLVRHRRVLGGKSECIPAHRLQHVVSAHPVVPGENVADGIVPDVPHVQLPRGVGEHAQAIELLPGGVFFDAEGALALPVILGFALYRQRIVSVLHVSYCTGSRGL